MKIKAFIGVLLLTFAVANTSGCATSGKVGAVKYSFTYSAVGIPKYDKFLKSAKTVIDKLDKADSAVNGLVPALKEAATAVGTATSSTVELGESKSFGDLFKKMVGSLKEAKLTLYIAVSNGKAAVKIKVATGGDESVATKVTAAFEAINKSLTAIATVPADLASATKAAVDLVGQVKGLTGTVKSDFTGMKAMKIPGAIAALAKAGVELAKVPARLVSIIKGAGQLVTDLKGMATGQ